MTSNTVVWNEQRWDIELQQPMRARWPGSITNWMLRTCIEQKHGCQQHKMDFCLLRQVNSRGGGRACGIKGLFNVSCTKHSTQKQCKQLLSVCLHVCFSLKSCLIVQVYVRSQVSRISTLKSYGVNTNWTAWCVCFTIQILKIAEMCLWSTMFYKSVKIWESFSVHQAFVLEVFGHKPKYFGSKLNVKLSEMSEWLHFILRWAGMCVCQSSY